MIKRGLRAGKKGQGFVGARQDGQKAVETDDLEDLIDAVAEADKSQVATGLAEVVNHA